MYVDGTTGENFNLPFSRATQDEAAQAGFLVPGNNEKRPAAQGRAFSKDEAGKSEPAAARRLRVAKQPGLVKQRAGKGERKPTASGKTGETVQNIC